MNPLDLLGGVGLDGAVAEVAARLEQAGTLDPAAVAQLARIERKLDWLAGVILTVGVRHARRLGLDPDTLAHGLPPTWADAQKTATTAHQEPAGGRNGHPAGEHSPETVTGHTIAEAADRVGRLMG